MLGFVGFRLSGAFGLRFRACSTGPYALSPKAPKQNGRFSNYRGTSRNPLGFMMWG